MEDCGLRNCDCPWHSPRRGEGEECHHSVSRDRHVQWERGIRATIGTHRGSDSRLLWRCAEFALLLEILCRRDEADVHPERLEPWDGTTERVRARLQSFGVRKPRAVAVESADSGLERPFPGRLGRAGRGQTTCGPPPTRPSPARMAR
jgi:hypothetical protein